MSAREASDWEPQEGSLPPGGPERSDCLMDPSLQGQRLEETLFSGLSISRAFLELSLQPGELMLLTKEDQGVLRAEDGA